VQGEPAVLFDPDQVFARVLERAPDHRRYSRLVINKQNPFWKFHHAAFTLELP
jgi:hypothetical protein